MARPPKTRTLIAAGLALWLAAVGVGFSRLWQYAYTPGPAASASATWPDATIRRGDLENVLRRWLARESPVAEPVAQ